MTAIIELITKEMQLKGCLGEGKGSLSQMLDKTSALVTVGDKVGYRDHLQPKAFFEVNQLGQAGTGAVLIEDFTNHATGMQSG